MNIKKILLFSGLLLLAVTLSAQVTGPGDPGGDPNIGGDPPLGGGAPVGEGFFILISLGAAYGGKKLYHFIDKINELNDKQYL